MKTKKLLIIVTIISLIVVGESLAANALQNQPEEETTPDLFDIGTVYIKINVSETEFTPVTFTVKESAKVNLTIESLDIGHTFEISEYGIDEEIAPASTINIAFTADQYGSFTYSSVNCSETGTMVVEDPYVPNLPRPEELDILIDLRHNSDPDEMYVEFSYIFNWTEENNFNVIFNEDDNLVDSTLEGVDLLVILKPDLDFEEAEWEPLRNYLANGGGLLIGGSNITSTKNTNELIKPFGFNFTNATARHINSTDLTDPIGENNTVANFFVSNFDDHPIFTEDQYVPLTNVTVERINYLGNVLEYNESWIIDYLNESDMLETEIYDSYVLANGNESIYADMDGDGVVDENETIGIENILIGSTETLSGARIITLGSANAINNSQVGRYPENGHFYQRAVQWLTKMYAVIENHEFTVDKYIARRNVEINYDAIFKAQNNTVLAEINATLRIMRITSVERTLEVPAINETHYEGTIETSELTIGTIYINIIANKRGYGFNTTKSIYLQIDPEQPDPNLPPIPIIITYTLSIIIGIVGMTFFYLKGIKGKKIPTVEETSTEEEEEEVEAESEEEEIDLDEYETE